MTRVLADLGAYAGAEARLRFRLACDSTDELPEGGWHIDDAVVSGWPAIPT